MSGAKDIVLINVLQLRTEEESPVEEVLVVDQGVVITKLYNFLVSFCLIDFLLILSSPIIAVAATNLR